jgi:hypothetical protein
MTLVQERQSAPTIKGRRLAALLGHAFVGWALCDLTMVVGMTIASLEGRRHKPETPAGWSVRSSI